ncbi:DNA polymerase [Kitasatospora sp. NBC_00070]|uniref:DNA polymerase n=1 Tax=Kitasatospora sp. NBC_00070 TaxID=2975962 RepID=UPI00325191DB
MRTYHHQVAGETVTINIPETGEDLDQFYAWAQEADRRGPIALDTETTGLEVYSSQFRLRTVQFGDRSTAWVIHWERGGEFQQFARAVLTHGQRFLIHHAAYDWSVLDRHAGIPLESLAPRTRDTRIMAALIDPRQPSEGGRGTGLKPLSAHWVDPLAPDTQDGLLAEFHAHGLTKATGWAQIPLHNHLFNLYAGLDVILLARLEPHLRGELDHLGVRARLVDYEHQIARVCAHMQRTGLILDEDYTRELSRRLADEAERFATEAARYGVANVNSTRQIAEALAGMGEHLPERTASGQVKVDKAVLLQLADLDGQWSPRGTRTPNPLANAVLRSKRSGKWQTTYAQTFLDSVDDGGRIHPLISPLAARTGRMSISRPALQTLPGSDQTIRQCLLADEGHVMVSADFTAVEMRVLASLADIKQMKSAIASGNDLHDFTAELVFGPGFTKAHRKLAKAIGFGKVYGGGCATISRQSGAPYAEVERALAAYDRVYPEIRRAASRWQREAFGNGMTVITPVGRRIPLDRSRSYAATNYMCQSTARDLLGQSLLDMEAAGLLPLLRLPIHDEVLVSAPAKEAEDVARAIVECMTTDLYGVRIDASASIGGRSWGSLYGLAA